MGHTPGPRTTYPPNTFRAHWVVESDEGNLLVNIMESDDPEADAQLIAVAPKLLEACEEAHEWFRRFTRNSETVYEDESRMLVLLEAAIEKVKGE